ncbi:hypothetical protein [Myxococcus stipitatus]|uniref:hypothetical protein n=1 Tax=Myxococcus stipitatus TaxID=83455 RepID=UPI0030CA8ECE
MLPPPSVLLPPISVGDVAVADVALLDVELQVLGSNFTAPCSVYLDNQELATRFISETELRARIPRRLFWNENDPSVDVRIRPDTPGYPGGARSPFAQVPRPIPELHSLSPETLDSEPSAPVVVTVTGKNFVNNSEAIFRGNRYPLTLTSPGEGTVRLPASALGTHSDGDMFQVEVPLPRGYTSTYVKTAARSLAVKTPAPGITGIWPPTLNAVDKLHGKAGDASTTVIEVSGTKLRSTTVVKWNGTPLNTFSSPYAGRVRAFLPFNARLDETTAQVSLETPSTQGPLESTRHPLVVKTEPVLYTLSPAWVPAHATGVTFELRGEGFGESRQQTLLWNGSPLAPESFTRVTGGPEYDKWTFRVPDALLTQPGVFPVRVKRTYDGAESAPLLVQVVAEAPAPLSSSLRPAVLSVGDAPGALYVQGSAFTAQSVVLVDGQARVTRFHGAGSVSTDLIPSDLERVGVLTITVRTPAPGGGTSLPLLLPVHEERSVPTIQAVMGPGGANPVLARSEPMTLHVQGQGFTPASEVRWEGQPMPTQWQCLTSPCTAGPGVKSELTAIIPAERARVPGPARVTVFTPGPGGGESRPRHLVLASEPETTLSLSPTDLNLGALQEGEFRWVSFTPHGLNGAEVSKVLVNGIERPFESAFSSFRVSAQETAAEGVLEVRTYAVGRGLSAPAHLYVQGARTPRIQSVNPGVISRDSLWSGHPAPAVELMGQDFKWPDEPARDSRLMMSLRAPTQPLVRDVTSPGDNVSTALLSVEIPGVRTVTLSRVAGGGGTSLPALLNVVPERAVPLLTRLEPMTVSAGAPHLRLRIWGEGIHPSSHLRWKDFLSSLKPVLSSAGGIAHFEADLPAAALETPGEVDVTVQTLPPGGGTSLPIRVVVE